MAALQNYSRFVVFYNGQSLEQITSCERSTNSGQQRVDLLNEGLGGFSPGSGDVTIAIGFAVPIGGTEADFERDAAEGRFVDMQIGLGRTSYAGRGKITDVRVSQSVNAAVEGSFNWTGELRAPE
jgi:hypothetical protein